jgi:serine phosphatase RsbU (regulator of sigma subunit)
MEGGMSFLGYLADTFGFVHPIGDLTYQSEPARPLVPPFRLQTIAAILILGLLYAVAGRLGLLTAMPPGYATAVWPASGIALAAILLYGAWIWPGIWLGSFVLNSWVYISLTNGSLSVTSVAAAALIATGASLAPLAAAFLLRRIRVRQSLFSQAGNVVRFAVIGVFGSCLVSAAAGAASLCVVGIVGWADFLPTWWTWWIGDAAGVLVVTPLLLTWSKTKVTFTPWRIVEGVTLMGLLVTVAAIAFGTGNYPFPYIVLPILVAIALRFKQAGATVAIASVFVIGAIYTALGVGPFSNQMRGLNVSLLLFGSFIVVNGLTILILAAVWEDRDAEVLNVAREMEHATLAERQRHLFELYAASVTAESLRKTSELQEATELQLSMVPASLPDIAGFDIAARMQSAQEVGGDYYNALTRRTPNLPPSYLFCVADVSGKGLIASLLMSNFQAMLLTLGDGLSPLGEIASRLSTLLQVHPKSRYITSIIVEFDAVTNVGHYVSAGHPSGILLSADGTVKRLPSTKFPLGMFAEELTNDEAIFSFESGDLLALFTDGVTEAADHSNQEFGETRLLTYLRKVYLRPAADIVAGAIDEVNRFVGSAPQSDDITLLVIKRITPARPE